MNYCLNPNCQKASSNPEQTQFCLHCGAKLLLKERYRSIKPIGQGGFGRTFLAIDEDKPSKPRCVIKQFYPQAQGTDNSQKAAELFAQEAVRLDELGKHPQIPELFAYFTQDERQYLVQEYIDGNNLEQILIVEGAFSEEQIRQLLSSLLPVLDFVHAHNIIHRDIKPENIICRQDGQLVLVDFGATKFATGTALARTGTVIGSAGYAAPEQAMGKAVFASDLYSLGVTCTHLLTQVDPFDLYSMVEATWIWRDYLSNPVSDAFAQILDKMLEGGTKRRYQSASEILTNINPQMKLPTAVGRTPAKHNAPLPPNATALRITQSKSNSQAWKCVKSLAGYSSLLAGVRSVAISPDSQVIASGSEDNSVKIWNLITSEEIFTLSGHSSFVRSVAFSPDGKTLVSGSNDKTIKLWNIKTGKEICTWSGHSKEVTTVCISSDGRTLASGSDDKTIKIWHPQTGRQNFTLTGHSNYIQSVAFSPDGRILASGSCDNTIKIWSVKKGNEICTLSGHSSWIKAIVFSPDGEILASGSDDNTIKIWKLSTGEMLRSFAGHSGWINGVLSVAISPDGQLLASGGADKTVKLWNLGTGELLCNLRGHSNHVTSVIFSPDRQAIASGSLDKTIKIWRRK